MALALLLLVSFASLVQPVEGKMTAIKRTSSGGPLRRSTRNAGGQPRAPDGDGPAVSKRTYRGSFQLDGVPWQRHRDPKGGKEYYFNVATKESVSRRGFNACRACHQVSMMTRPAKFQTRLLCRLGSNASR